MKALGGSFLNPIHCRGVGCLLSRDRGGMGNHPESGSICTKMGDVGEGQLREGMLEDWVG